jgi:pimeloyl-ACP methyl ester carboxylesterase
MVRWSTAAPLAQATGSATLSVDTDVLSIAYEDRGPSTGFPVILLHGFPDDVRAYDDVVPRLVRAGYRTLVPYLRGHGPTRFRDPAAPRMAEQAALGQDVIDFADALRVTRFALAGYDWGGRAAAIAAALHPNRVRGAALVARRVVPGVGHFMPREAPADMASALLELLERTRERP